MGSIADNIEYYEQYDWRHGGLEWSAPWGSTHAMWIHSLLPRIRPYLPAPRIVEIGAGHGRIAHRLLGYATEELVLVDIVGSCVRACEQTFATESRVRCVQGDGGSLESLDDASVDLAVSFYSLVHADCETLAAYAGELSRVLSPNGSRSFTIPMPASTSTQHRWAIGA